MQSEPFLEFLARQGHRIVETKSCYWFNASTRFYFYYPYNRLITPSEDELNRILWGEPSIGVRYFAPMEHYGKESYNIVCSDKNYDFASVDAHYARRQTRRGLENFKIQQIEVKDLEKLGICLNCDTLIRQKRDPRIWVGEMWHEYCSAMNGLDGFEVWGAFSENNLASFMVTYLMEDCFTILYQSSATKYLPLYPNNALVFYITKLKLGLPEVNAVSYGPESLDAPKTLDKFKFRMGFQKKPMKQAIVFNPLVRPLINGFSHRLIKYFSALMPKSDPFRKLEGTVRFYREAT
jgi:hypothetical protein